MDFVARRSGQPRPGVVLLCSLRIRGWLPESTAPEPWRGATAAELRAVVAAYRTSFEYRR